MLHFFIIISGAPLITKILEPSLDADYSWILSCHFFFESKGISKIFGFCFFNSSVLCSFKQNFIIPCSEASEIMFRSSICFAVRSGENWAASKTALEHKDAVYKRGMKSTFLRNYGRERNKSSSVTVLSYPNHFLLK